MNDAAARGELGTGVEEIDREHDLQVALVDELRAVLGRGDWRAATGVAEQLSDYSDVHFGSEELMMRARSYGRYHEHVEEHRKLLDQLAALRARIATGEDDVRSLADDLRRWLAGHVRGPDRELAAFLQGEELVGTD